MSGDVRKLIQTFDAAYADGRVCQLGLWTTAINVESRGGDQVATGQKVILLNGQRVNRLEKGKYQVVQTGEILTATSADAP